MKINFKMDGGLAYLPALSKPFSIDTTQLETREANQLESLVQGARFFNQPAQAAKAAKGAADYRTYTITVEDGPHVHTIQLTDPIADMNLQKLVSHLRSMSQPSK